MLYNVSKVSNLAKNKIHYLIKMEIFVRQQRRLAIFFVLISWISIRSKQRASLFIIVYDSSLDNCL